MKRRLLTWAGLALLLAAPAAWSQQREVTGRVIAEGTGEPLPGAEVFIEGTRLGTLTDEDGNFRIRVPEGDVTLRANFLGYKSEAEPVPADQNTVEIALEEDVLQLEGVVVTGLAASIARRNAGNAVAVVTDTLIGRVPTQSLESALQGKIPGALIESNSGAPGGGIQVKLRGVTSINADAEPLYVVDGVIVSNAAIQPGSQAVTRAAGQGSTRFQDNPVNRIADLDPREIERVEVLKGASAAAIYGGKAANGVVVITTKRGSEGKPQFNVEGRMGTFALSNTLGSRQFETLEEAQAAFPPERGEEIAALFTGRSFDHEEELYGENDISYETSASASGGAGATRYYAAGLLKNDQGIMEGTGYEKQTLRLNLDQRLGANFNVSLSSNLIHTQAKRGLSNNDNNGVSYYVALASTPSFVNLQPTGDPPVYPLNPFVRSNPIQTRDLMSNEQDVFRYLGSIRGTYDLIQTGRHNLQFIGDIGVDHFNQEDELVFPPELQFEPVDDGLPGTSIRTEGDNTNLNTSANLAFTFSPGTGTYSSTTTTGIQYTESDLTTSQIVTRDLLSGQSNVDQGSSVTVSEDRGRVEEFGIYGQEEFLLLKERLLLTAGLRADQSSSNGDPDKFFVYPKAAVSYRFPDPATWLEELKLRGAFGQTGNRPLFGQKFTPLAASNIEGRTGVSIDESITAGDADIKPERQTEFELGFDATMFEERAALEFTVYQKTISDLILERTLAPSVGFVDEIFNGGELRNRGVEVALNLTPVLSDRVNWLFRTTFFTNRSKITELPVPAFNFGGFSVGLGSYRIEEGASATQIIGNQGRDAQGNPIVVKLGDASPDFLMSFVNDINFQNWNLYSLLEWKKGGDIINLTDFLYDLGANSEDYELGEGEECPPLEETEPDSPGVCRFAAIGLFTRPLIQDGSFLKLRELSLSYDIAPLLGGGFFGQDVRYVRLGMSGRNLLTATPYLGVDPEVSNFANKPIDRNIDVGPFPPSRSFWLTLSVGF